MKIYYIRLTITNYIQNDLSKGMIKVNRYKRQADGKYYKEVGIKCNSQTEDKVINYITNRFSKVAESNKIQFKIEIYKDKKLSKKMGERLTKNFHKKNYT